VGKCSCRTGHRISTARAHVTSALSCSRLRFHMAIESNIARASVRAPRSTGSSDRPVHRVRACDGSAEPSSVMTKQRPPEPYHRPSFQQDVPASVTRVCDQAARSPYRPRVASANPRMIRGPVFRVILRSSGAHDQSIQESRSRCRAIVNRLSGKDFPAVISISGGAPRNE